MTSFTVNDSLVVTKKFIGEWEYSVPDAPYQYQAGTFIFSKVEKKLSGTIAIDGYKTDLSNVVTKKNNLTCEVYIEGETVTFDLTFTKKSFSGTASYSQGELDISGSKKK
jgi:hypothetical protein